MSLFANTNTIFQKFLITFARTDPDAILKHLRERIVDNELYYILLDEVQLIPEFEDVLNSLLHVHNADVYVTGSNSHFLSSDIITEFRGRGDEIHLYPLSFSEFCEGCQSDKNKAWKEYYTYGGLPLILSLDTEKKKADYLINLYKSVYLVDIIERHKIKNKAELDELVRIMASSSGKPALLHPVCICFTKRRKNPTGICIFAQNRRFLQKDYHRKRRYHAQKR